MVRSMGEAPAGLSVVRDSVRALLAVRVHLEVADHLVLLAPLAPVPVHSVAQAELHQVRLEHGDLVSAVRLAVSARRLVAAVRSAVNARLSAAVVRLAVNARHSAAAVRSAVSARRLAEAAHLVEVGVPLAGLAAEAGPLAVSAVGGDRSAAVFGIDETNIMNEVVFQTQGEWATTTLYNNSEEVAAAQLFIELQAGRDEYGNPDRGGIYDGTDLTAIVRLSDDPDTPIDLLPGCVTLNFPGHTILLENYHPMVELDATRVTYNGNDVTNRIVDLYVDVNAVDDVVKAYITIYKAHWIATDEAITYSIFG